MSSFLLQQRLPFVHHVFRWNRSTALFASVFGGATVTTAVVAACPMNKSPNNLFVSFCFSSNNNSIRNGTSTEVRSQDVSLLATSSQATVTFDLQLIVPTLQSMQRIIRLLGTCVVMTLDYKLVPLYEEINNAKKAIRSISNSTRKGTIGHAVVNAETVTDFDVDEQRAYWECEVTKRQKEFDLAQEIYSTTTDSQRTMSIEERVHVKQNEKQHMIHTAKQLATAQEQLSTLITSGNDENDKHPHNPTTTMMSMVHARNAKRLLELCQINRGVYIKIGQHLANLDYLVPNEYISALKVLYDSNPITTYDNVSAVIQEDFDGLLPTQIFDSFDPTPIASASLAQVHVAYKDGKKYAVKVQHRGLRETSRGDIISLEYAVRLAEYLFPNDFTLGWLADEMAPNLPKELNFINEGHNAERASLFLQSTNLSCIVPKVHWDKTSSRVLTMDFEEGVKVTDTAKFEEMGINKQSVGTLISSIFASQVFLSGHVHCDPHEANVFVRKDMRTGKPVIVLFDHGLYKTLDTEFRIQYAKLWKSLMIADVNGIMNSCHELGIQDNEACRLFAGIITARPFDEMIERNKSNQESVYMKMYRIFQVLTNRGKDKSDSRNELDSKSDEAIIRGYAQRFLPNIVALLAVIPRQVLMLLKMNDCLRHIDYRLGIPSTNTIMVTGQYAAYAIYQHEQQQRQQHPKSWKKKLDAWWSYIRVVAQIRINEILIYWLHAVNKIAYL